MFHMLAAIDKFQRELIVGGIHESLAAVRARGRTGGRKPKLTPKQVQVARSMCEAPWRRREAPAHRPGNRGRHKVFRPTIYGYLQQGVSA